MKRILWFRRDLRIEDNPLLSFGAEVLPIFIFDSHILNHLPSDDRRVTFLFESVVALKKGLQQINLDLKIFWGEPVAILRELGKKGFEEVVASGDYDTYAQKRDKEVADILSFRWIDDTYIFHPNEIHKDDGTPYLVFTPFYNKTKKVFTKAHLRQYNLASHTLYATSYEGITQVSTHLVLPLSLDSLGFTYKSTSITPLNKKLDHLASLLPHYAQERDYLSSNTTSSLSLELRFGLISIRAILRFLLTQKKQGTDTEPFFRQLIFRDYYAYLLYHFPTLETNNHKYHFNGIEDENKYHAFCNAQTGVPIVDAGVRELLTSGTMHNRVRMVVASFFTKDLLLPWQWGERFFAQYLLDFDKASNVLSWQWSAGTGIDPQPYFRIFNPYLQSKKFDKDAIYIKRWLPQIKDIAPKHLHDELFLLNHTIQGYPQPILLHKEASQIALGYFKQNL